jgi:peroxiredoxin-like protein
MPTEHAFECAAEWRGELLRGAGSLKAEQIESDFSVPRRMGGTGRGTSPEELLVAAANACYLMTLAALLQTEGVAFGELRNHSSAVFAATPAGPVFSQLRHSPVVYMAAEARLLFGGTVQSCFLQAERACTVSRALAGNVRLSVQGRIESLPTER